jgi:glycosyltransferase involved in cell wall biosynthesis
MRILHVVHEDPLAVAGGVQVYARQLAEEQAARGHEVSLFTTGRVGPEAPRVEEARVGDVRYWRVNRDRLSVATKRFRFFDSFRNAEVAALFREATGSVALDVVHVHHLLLLSGEIVHGLRERPVALVATLHDYWYLCHRIKLLYPNLADCDGPQGGRKCHGCGDPVYGTYPARLAFPAIYWSFIHRTNYLLGVLGAFDRLLAPSLLLRQMYIRNGVPAHRIAHSLTGIREVLYEYRAADRAERVFGYVGALQPAKGVDLLVRAFNELTGRPAVLRLLGTGEPEYVAHLRSIAENPRIEFAGAFENERLPEALAGLDALVLPSIWKENSPVSIHEALAARVPVLASRIGGIPELVRDGENGLLFEPRNVAAIRRAVERVLAEPSALARFSAASGMARSFAADVAGLETIYRDILRARSLCA